MFLILDAAAPEEHSFVAAKLTAMFPPKVLMRLTNSLNQSKAPVAVNGIIPETRHFLKMSTGPDEHYEALRPRDFEILDAVFPIVLEMFQYAADRNVRILVDAEQSYFKLAIGFAIF
jgi:hypothetical protein